MDKVSRFLLWLDENLMFIITSFLLAFIPLYPKLPLFDAIPGYIVRVRIEDLLIAGTLVIWVIQLWRRKVSFGPNPLTKPVIVYLTIGALSMLSAIFLIKTVPMEVLHIGKMVLHWLRRIEYFSLFFIFYSSVKSLKQVKIYLTVLILTVLGVILYGYGQKYLYWPAFSTMNREFSKGWALYLTQHARVLSTFGGHYDLAAFIMGALIMLWAIFFSLKKLWLKILTFLVLAGAFWLLILTVSRTSFIAYLAGVTILFGLWMFKQGIKWSLKRWVAVVVLSMLVMLTLGDLSDRFTKLLKLDQRLSGIKSLLLQPVGAPPKGEGIAFLENNIAAVTSKSDFPPLLTRPTDVTENIPEGLVATQSATGSAIIQVVPRTYSQAALVFDLSTGIRLDALWPRAIEGWKKNLLLGSGYSTLSKTQVTEFTEAESTDNDYLRALGETGLLGFLAFGWIIGMIVWVIWKNYLYINDKVFFGAVLGLFAVIVGLLVNAVYIDIFEASKVALSFWAVSGLIMGGIKIINQDSKGEKVHLSRKKFPEIPDGKEMIGNFKMLIMKVVQSDKTYLLLLIILAFGLRYYKINEPLADWHSWRQADTSAVTRNYVRYGINPLYPRYDDLSSVASGKPNPEGYRFVEFPIYNILAVVVDKLFPGYTVEYSGRLTSIFASLGTLVFLYLLVKKYFGVRTAFLTGFFFAVIPYNIFWSRTILPEPTLVMLTTGLIFWFDRWISGGKWRDWLLAVIFAMLALLVKFTSVFFALPLAYLCWKKWGWKMFLQPLLYIFVVLWLAPFFTWRWHISYYPEGIPAYTWLLNGNGIRFKGAWWQWLFADRMARIILGGWGVGLFTIGLIRPIGQMVKKISGLFLVWLLTMFIYLAVFATGNVQHDYYQIILIPIICVFLARGADLLLTKSEAFNLWLSRICLSVVVLFMLMFGWYIVRDYYNINHIEIVEAGQDFDRIIANKNAKVIAPYNGDTAFLYLTGSRGWPLMEGTIEEMIQKGAHYYISTNFDQLTNDLIDTSLKAMEGMEKDKIKQNFKIIKHTNLYVIIQLVANNQIPNK